MRRRDDLHGPGLIIKWISGDYPVTQILATRSLVAFAPLFILLHFDGGLRGVNGRRLGRLLLRAALLFASYTTYYLAIAAIPLAEAVSLFYTAPLFIVALSGPMLHERVGPTRWLAVVVGFIGAVVMCRPGADVVDPAALLSLFAAALYASAQVMARDLGTTYRASVMALAQKPSISPPRWRSDSSPATAPMPAPPIPACPSCCARG